MAALVVACGSSQAEGEERVGTYTYADGSHSFTPCGARVVYPLVPGAAQGELEALAKTHGGSVVLALRTRSVLEEAAEGAGEDEYLEVVSVLGERKCP